MQFSSIHKLYILWQACEAIAVRYVDPIEHHPAGYEL